MMLFIVFFFFQAEDGIRDLYVTGVQTCALPIFLSGVFFSATRFPAIIQPLVRALPLTAAIDALRSNMLQGVALPQDRKSVVGKECRSRWSPYHYKKKIILKVVIGKSNTSRYSAH